MIAIGGYLSDHVRGFQTSFRRYKIAYIPCYDMMYYGGIVEAAFGCVYILFLLPYSLLLQSKLRKYQ